MYYEMADLGRDHKAVLGGLQRLRTPSPLRLNCRAMAHYTLYRHPLRGLVAIRASSLQALLGQETRLLRDGYAYSGSAEADDERAALVQSVRLFTSATPSQATQPFAANPQPQAAHRNARAGQVIGTTMSVAFLISAAVVFLVMQEQAQEEPIQAAAADIVLGEFGPWMDFDDINRHSSQVDSERYQVSGAESRVHDGVGECRLRYAAVDRERPVQWLWRCALSDAELVEADNEYSAQGYSFVQHHHFTRDDGQNWASAVWIREEAQ